METVITYNKEDLKRLIIDDIHVRTGQSIDTINVSIETKSSQNYKSEWEQADFRGVYRSIK